MFITFYQCEFGHVNEWGESLLCWAETQRLKQSRKRKISPFELGWSGMLGNRRLWDLSEFSGPATEQLGYEKGQRARRDTLGENFVRESVWHKHKIHTSKQPHEYNRFDSVVAMPQFQRPSVHKAVPISSCLMTHTEDVKTVSIISVGFQNLYIDAEK